ncbi:MAG: hypothetical protein Q4G58_04710 [bacterium]|nr:hypothetical protein [bacterium]
MPKHFEMLYAVAENRKEIQYFEHAEHASSYASDPKRYKEIVKEFVEKEVI